MQERAHLRVAVRGWVEFPGRELAAARCRLEDLSTEGALLAGPPATWAGSTRMALRCMHQRVELDAMAVWSEVRDRELHAGARFRNVAPATVRQLRRVVLAVSTRAPWASVLLAEVDPVRRYELAEGLWADGCDVEEASGPVAVVEALARKGSRPAFVVIGDVDGATAASDLAEVLRRDFPGVRRVLLPRAADARVALAELLQTASDGQISCALQDSNL